MLSCIYRYCRLDELQSGPMSSTEFMVPYRCKWPGTDVGADPAKRCRWHGWRHYYGRTSNTSALP